MSRLGFVPWSPNSEMFVMGVVGMFISAAEVPLLTFSSDMKEVWSMDLPSEKFSLGMQYLLRLILICAIITRAVTVHGYVISFLLTTWPIFLDEQGWMLLPWLVIGGIKNIVTELVVLLTGSFIFQRYGSPFTLICLEFLVIKGVTLTVSTYIWVSYLFLYKDLSDPPKIFKWDETSTNKRLELAMRRRMCRTLCTEVVWRRRMLEDLEGDNTAHATVSLDEELFQERKFSRILPNSRSLDNLLDKIETDWDMLDNMTSRRSFEAKGIKQTLTARAKKFLNITKLDIEEAKERRKKMQDINDKATQTNTLSKKFMDTYGRSQKSFQFSTGRQGSHISDLAKDPDLSPIPPMKQKFSPVTLRPEMSDRKPQSPDRYLTANSEPPLIEPRVRSSLLRHLNVSMPPRYGYRHATTQVNSISRKYLEEQYRTRGGSDASEGGTPREPSGQETPSEPSGQPTPSEPVVAVVVSPPEEETEQVTTRPSKESSASGVNNDHDEMDIDSVAPSEANNHNMASKGPVSKRSSVSRRKSSNWQAPHNVKSLLGYTPDPSREQVSSPTEQDGVVDENEPEVVDALTNVAISELSKDRMTYKTQSFGSKESTSVAETLNTDAFARIPIPIPSKERLASITPSLDSRRSSGSSFVSGTETLEAFTTSLIPITRKERIDNKTHSSTSIQSTFVTEIEPTDEMDTDLMAFSTTKRLSLWGNPRDINNLGDSPGPSLAQSSSTTISRANAPKEDVSNQNNPPTRAAVLAPDNATPGTSREPNTDDKDSPRVNFNPTVNRVGNIKTDNYPFGVGLAQTRIGEYMKTKNEASGGSYDKQSKLEFRPSIRTIKRYANQAQYNQTFADNSYVSMPVEFTPQQTNPSLVEVKGETLKVKTKTKSEKGKKKNVSIVAVSPTESDSNSASLSSKPSVVSTTTTNKSVSPVDSEIVQRPERESDEVVLSRVLALNEEKLTDATQKHERQRSNLILQQLETDEDFALARPQSSLDPVRRVSSGSLREFLARKEKSNLEEESNQEDEDN